MIQESEKESKFFLFGKKLNLSSSSIVTDLLIKQNSLSCFKANSTDSLDNCKIGKKSITKENQKIQVIKNCEGNCNVNQSREKENQIRIRKRMDNLNSNSKIIYHQKINNNPKASEIFIFPNLKNESIENKNSKEKKKKIKKLKENKITNFNLTDSEEEKNFGNDTLKENVVAEKTTAKLPKKPNFSKVKENNAILIDRLKNHKLILEAKAAKENKRQLEEQKLKDQNLKLERRAKFLLLNEFLKSLEDFKLNTLISEKKKEQLLKCNSNNEVKCVDNINSLIECDDADLNFSKNYGV
ncbi:hypothetical protein HDU92_005780 [Lobulomyces angularis]|nr:hypothetical protein HDU92_005780 [Lobulomyces angularis]